MPGQNGKGNPASHRMSNPNLKARRQRSWNKAQVEKPKRNAENQARAAANAAIRAIGSLEVRERQTLSDPDRADIYLTPHEQQRLKRRIKRDSLRKRGLLPPIGTTRAAWEKTRPTTERNPA